MIPNWQFDNLPKLLENARNGDKAQLDELTNNNPFAQVNADFTKLLVLRKFRVKKMSFMPQGIVSINPPNDENFQWGISIVTTAEDGETNYSVYIPNKYTYTGLEFVNDEVTILAHNLSVKTNIRELHKKLREFHPMFDPTDLENAFNALNNEQSIPHEPSEPIWIEPVIEHEFLGTLTFDKEHAQYQNNRSSKYFFFELGVYNEEPEHFQELLGYVEAKMKAEFYKQHLLDMEPEIIRLKNTSWLEEGEKEVTPEAFREFINVVYICFFSDKSCTIFCSDGELFGDHAIDIHINKNGKYESVTLVG